MGRIRVTIGGYDYPARAAGQGIILHQFLSSSFFFLHSRSLRLCISSVRFLSSSSSSSVNTSKSYISDMT